MDHCSTYLASSSNRFWHSIPLTSLSFSLQSGMQYYSQTTLPPDSTVFILSRMKKKSNKACKHPYLNNNNCFLKNLESSRQKKNNACQSKTRMCFQEMHCLTAQLYSAGSSRKNPESKKKILKLPQGQITLTALLLQAQ